MTLYFARHGQCVSNANGILAGKSDDSPLTELGKTQAKQLASQLKAANITTIICSPLVRAKDTALIIAAELAISGAAVITDERLAERDMGQMSGQRIKDLPDGDWSDVPGVERPEDFKKRVLSAMSEIAQRQDDVVLVVAHAAVYCMIVASRQGIDPSDFFSVQPIANGHVTTLDVAWLQT